MDDLMNILTGVESMMSQFGGDMHGENSGDDGHR